MEPSSIGRSDPTARSEGAGRLTELPLPTSVAISPSHGSAIANITAGEQWNLTINGRTWTGNESTEVLIPFLRPDRGYQYRFESSSTVQAGLIQTEPSPWQWNTTSEAIRPGQRIYADGGPCTLAFLYRDATNETLYAMTAGHCIDEIESDVFLSDAVPDEFGNDPEDPLLGTAIYASQFEAKLQTEFEEIPDFGFIRIDNALRDQINPQVAHFGGPTGIWQDGDDSVGEVVCAYGHGNAIGWLEATRPRCGEIDGRNGQNLIMAWMPIMEGDSGAPVIHESGRGAGLVTHYLPPFVGITDICYINEAMNLTGIELELLAAATTDSSQTGLPAIGLYESDACLFR